MPEVLTPPEVAAWLGVSASTVRRMAAAGEIPAVRVGAQWRFCRDRLVEWMGGNP